MSLDEMEFHRARILLEWQVDLGATEAIGDAPVNRFELPDKQAVAPVPVASAPPAIASALLDEPPEPPPPPDPVAEAEAMAAAAGDLAALREAMDAFPYCDLRQGARNFVFADGLAHAPVMVIGEAPGRDEDQAGRPFVGRAGQLLDRMLAAIGRDRAATEPDRAVYITNILPWRPPQNRDPSPEEMAMMRPFVARHVALAAPRVLVLMGNIPCQALLGRKGITRMRGQWVDVLGRPALPTFHPSYLLRCASRGDANPKRQAWADLQALRAALTTSKS